MQKHSRSYESSSNYTSLTNVYTDCYECVIKLCNSILQPFCWRSITQVRLKNRVHGKTNTLRNKVSSKTIVINASCNTQIRSTHTFSALFITVIKIYAFFYAYCPFLDPTTVSQLRLISIPVFSKTRPSEFPYSSKCLWTRG